MKGEQKNLLISHLEKPQMEKVRGKLKQVDRLLGGRISKDAFPPRINVGVGNEQGEFLQMTRQGDGKFLLRRAGKATGYELNTYEIDRNGKQTQLAEALKNFDVRSRPDYKTALQSRKFGFSNVFSSLIDSSFNISASAPIYNSQGNLVGVTSAIIRLSEFGDFLRNIRVSKSGQIFILERSGLLVATSTNEEPFRIADGQPIRLAATKSGNSLTQATAQYLVTQFGDLNRIKDLQQLNFQFEGKRQFLEVRPLQVYSNVDWLVVVVVPEADFMGQIDRNMQITILLCVGAFGLATVLAILTSRWIAGPIHRLSRAAKELAKRATEGDFANGEDSVVVVQGVNELEVLAGSFNQMAQQLRQSFSALATANKDVTRRVETAPLHLSSCFFDS